MLFVTADSVVCDACHEGDEDQDRLTDDAQGSGRCYGVPPHEPSPRLPYL